MKQYLKSMRYSIIAGICVFVIYPLLGKLLDDSKERYHTEAKAVLHNKIINIVADSINKSTSFLIFSNNQSYLAAFTYGLWMDLNIGDSIVKEKGSLQYIIYRDKAATGRIDTITYRVDTLTWKYSTIQSFASKYF